MKRLLVLSFALIIISLKSSGQTNSLEQLVFNYFVDSVFDNSLTGYPKIRFSGRTEKKHSDPSLDYTTCFSNGSEFKELYIEAIKLDSTEVSSPLKKLVNFQKANKILGKSRKYYIMRLYKGTKFDNMSIVKIELVKKNHLIEFYFEIRNDKIYDWCKQSILID